MSRQGPQHRRPPHPDGHLVGWAATGRWLLLLSALLCCAIGQTSWSASSLEQRLKDEQQELKQLKGQLKDYRNRLQRTKVRERAVTQELEETNRLLQQKGRDLQTLERQLKTQAEKHAAMLREMEELTQQLRARENLLRVRLRALYKQGRLAYLPFLLSATDARDFVERVRFTARLAQYDAQLLQQHSTNLEALERARRAARDREEQLAKARLRVAAKTEEIEKERLKKDGFLSKIREEQGSYVSAVREIEESSARLVALIAELEQQRKREAERQRKRELERQAQEQRQRQARRQPPPPSSPRPLETRDSDAQGSFVRRRGRLAWPIEGKLISGYGREKHPTFNTYTFNKGIGIGAPLGSDFRSVEAGEVLYADQFKGYGNLLIVSHGDSYYSLYAHAAELLVQVGEKVKRAQVVGKIGEGGSFNGPALYFEIRHHGKPENPLEWLANHRP